MKALAVLSCFSMYIAYTTSKGLILPSGMEQADYCKGCIATIAEIGKRKEDGESSKKIIANINKMCSSLAGVKNRTTCHHLLEHHNHDLEKIVSEVDDLQRMKTWFCHEHTFACIGIKTNPQYYLRLCATPAKSKRFESMTDEELLQAIDKTGKQKRIPNPVRATDEL